MKKLLLFLSLINSVAVISQPGGDAPSAAQLLDVPVLSGGTRPSTILPTAGAIRFDKRIKIISQSGSTTLQTCLYINTRMGILGYFNYPETAPGTCTINTDADGFRFNVHSLAGNNYTYITKQDNGGLKKTVITGNSDFYHTPGDFSPAAMPVSGTITKLNERGSIAGGISTYAYRVSGDSVRVHLLGASYPSQLPYSGNQENLTLYGVGYILLQNKVYLVMKAIFGISANSAITSIENVEVELNTTGFVILEQKIYSKETRKIEQEKARIMGERPVTGPCSGQYFTLKEFKLAALDRRMAYLEKSQQGNVYEDEATKGAWMNLFGYDDAIQEMIHKQELAICKLENGSAFDGKEAKLACYNRQLATMHRVKNEMRELKTRYADDPGKLIAARASLMLETATINCD